MGRPKKQPEKPVWLANKNKYNLDYVKNNVMQVMVKINRNTEADLIDFLNTIDNKQGFIKELIREYMKKTKEE